MNVPKAAEVLRAYYALPGNSSGGIVHIITEDGNVSDSDAKWCLAQARAGGNEAGMSRTPSATSSPKWPSTRR